MKKHGRQFNFDEILVLYNFFLITTWISYKFFIANSILKTNVEREREREERERAEMKLYLKKNIKIKK